MQEHSLVLRQNLSELLGGKPPKVIGIHTYFQERLMYLTQANIRNTKLGRAKFPTWHFVKDAEGSKTTSDDIAGALKIVGNEWCFQLTTTMYWTGFVKLKEPLTFGEMQRIMHWDYLRQSTMTDQESWVHCSNEEWRMSGPWTNEDDEETLIYEVDQDEDTIIYENEVALDKTIEHISPIKEQQPPRIMLDLVDGDTESTVEHFSQDDEEMSDLKSIEDEMDQVFNWRAKLPNYDNELVLDIDLNK